MTDCQYMITWNDVHLSKVTGLHPFLNNVPYAAHWLIRLVIQYYS